MLYNLLETVNGLVYTTNKKVLQQTVCVSPVQIQKIHLHLNVKPVSHVVVLTSGSGRMELSMTGLTGSQVSPVISTTKSVQDFMGMASGMMITVHEKTTLFAKKVSQCELEQFKYI